MYSIYKNHLKAEQKNIERLLGTCSGAQEEVIFLDLLQNICHGYLFQTLRLLTVCICIYLGIVKASQKSLSDQYQGR